MKRRGWSLRRRRKETEDNQEHQFEAKKGAQGPAGSAAILTTGRDEGIKARQRDCETPVGSALKTSGGGRRRLKFWKKSSYKNIRTRDGGRKFILPSKNERVKQSQTLFDTRGTVSPWPPTRSCGQKTKKSLQVWRHVENHESKKMRTERGLTRFRPKALCPQHHKTGGSSTSDFSWEK